MSDASRHAALNRVAAVPATASGAGTLEYWHCEACGKLFADADGKREITAADTVTDKIAPSIVKGGDDKWKPGDENGLSFRSDVAASDFLAVLVDGAEIAADRYIRHESGITVKLTADYLATLAKGEHTLTIRSVSGDAAAKFTIEAETVLPDTPQTKASWIWVISAAVVLGIGAAALVILVRRKRKV